jgi:hypothetical protein
MKCVKSSLEMSPGCGFTMPKKRSVGEMGERCTDIMGRLPILKATSNAKRRGTFRLLQVFLSPVF